MNYILKCKLTIIDTNDKSFKLLISVFAFYLKAIRWQYAKLGMPFVWMGMCSILILSIIIIIFISNIFLFKIVTRSIRLYPHRIKLHPFVARIKHKMKNYKIAHAIKIKLLNQCLFILWKIIIKFSWIFSRQFLYICHNWLGK